MLTDQVLAVSEVYAAFLLARRTEPELRVVIDALAEMFEREDAALESGIDPRTLAKDKRGP